jgi:GMP synthase (glutamine-hydrolysing)
LVFQHVPFEPLGTLDSQFRAAGFRIRYVNFHRRPEVDLSPRRYHGLVVLGGPMSADATDRHPHLAFEQEAIRESVQLGMPVLGICLGAQLIAASLGGRTLRGSATEIGWGEVTPTELGKQDPLVRHFHDAENIFQWHVDTFSLPAAAVHLARSASCEYQAFRVGETVYGLQFHLEADQALIARWLRTPQHLPDLERLAGSAEVSPTIRDITAQTAKYIDRATALSRAVFGEFIERFYGSRFALRRRLALPSR